MARETIPFNSSRLIRAVAPTDFASPNRPALLADGETGMGVAAFRVYKGSRTTSPVTLSGQAVLLLEDVTDFIVGETALIEQENGFLFTSAIIAIDPAANSLTLNDNLTADAHGGAKVNVELGSPIQMTRYGIAPKAGFKDWGFQGTFPSTHLGQVPELDIDIIVIVTPSDFFASTLTASQAAGATVLPVVDVSGYNLFGGPIAEFILDDGDFFSATISSVDLGANTMTLDTPLPSAAASGRFVGEVISPRGGQDRQKIGCFTIGEDCAIGA